MRRVSGIPAGACMLVAASVVSLVAQAQQGPSTPEDIERFLLTADVVEARQLGQGTTNPWRLTLANGAYRHDAAFQSVEQRPDGVQQVGARGEIAFADSYHFNIAAYRIARLVGLGDMVPPSVERSWRGRRGAFTWWIDNAFDEKQRQEERRPPPNSRSWQDQTYRMYVFGELVYDTHDRVADEVGLCLELGEIDGVGARRALDGGGRLLRNHAGFGLGGRQGNLDRDVFFHERRFGEDGTHGRRAESIAENVRVEDSRRHERARGLMENLAPKQSGAASARKGFPADARGCGQPSFRAVPMSQ